MRSHTLCRTEYFPAHLLMVLMFFSFLSHNTGLLIPAELFSTLLRYSWISPNNEIF